MIRRAFSSTTIKHKQPNLKYEYPTRSTYPTITTTLAKNTNGETSKNKLVQNQMIDHKHKITITPPHHPSSGLVKNDSTSIKHHKFDLNHTKLNNLNIISQETSYGQICTVGFLVESGSRNELPSQTGTNHLLELLAFQNTAKYTGSQISTLIHEHGGVVFCNSSREQMLYCIDILRDSIDMACDILAETILHPSITDEEVEKMKMVVQYQYEDIQPEIKATEGLQQAAYHNQPLGQPHFCPQSALPNITAESIKNYRKQLFTPERMVFAGACVEHEEMLRLGEQYFPDLVNFNGNENSTGIYGTQNSIYSGGEYREETPTLDGLTRVAVGFECGGWHDEDDLVPVCVLQVLLGGGSSFSAGGPGKGMYSRLYREVLNRYYWAEASEAFTSLHNESGIIGIKGSSVPARSKDMVRVFCEHIARIAIHDVTDEELSRAKNMLKCNVLSQLESRLVLFEDIGRQFLTYGKRESPAELCKKIEAVTKEDIRRVGQRALSKPPTISSVGDDLSNVPTYDELLRWFR